MGFIVLCFGLFLSVIGFLRLIQAFWFQSLYIQKWGQVVGFAEEVRGLFSVVLRFQGMNGKEYFLVDKEKSVSPPYVMGEFIPVLLSHKNPKLGLLYEATSRTQALMQIFMGLGFLVSYKFIFNFSKIDLLLSLLVAVAVWCLLVTFPQNYLIQRLRNLSISHFLSQMKVPLILEIEQSKLIKWSNNYAGVLAEEKTKFSFERGLAQVFRPLFLLASVGSLALAVQAYSALQKVINNSTKVGAVFDGTVNRQIFLKNLKLNVPVFRYYGPKKQIIAAVDMTTPLAFNLKPGQKLVAYLPQDQNLPVRLDRKWLNYWQSYLFIFLSVVLFKLSGAAKKKLQTKKKKPVIFLRRAS
ncbi:MAG: hypothetical protein ACK5V3_02745 [Bdellovibrionales bacterium]